MKVGASQYHPGLTVRWKRVRHGRTAIALYGKSEHASFAMISEWDGAWYWIARGSGKTARRCDAKRAAEVLVGQWWREKCEREAKAADYKARGSQPFAARTTARGRWTLSRAPSRSA